MDSDGVRTAISDWRVLVVGCALVGSTGAWLLFADTDRTLGLVLLAAAGILAGSGADEYEDGIENGVLAALLGTGLLTLVTISRQDIYSATYLTAAMAIAGVVAFLSIILVGGFLITSPVGTVLGRIVRRRAGTGETRPPLLLPVSVPRERARNILAGVLLTPVGVLVWAFHTNLGLLILVAAGCLPGLTEEELQEGAKNGLATGATLVVLVVVVVMVVTALDEASSILFMILLIAEAGVFAGVICLWYTVLGTIGSALGTLYLRVLRGTRLGDG